MKVILQLTDLDTRVIGLTENDEIAESIVKDSFLAEGVSGDELIKIIYEGRPVYGIRETYEHEVVDEFEYVDNDGNPINADGSEISSDEVVEDIPATYSDILWIIREVQPDQLVELDGSDFFIPENDLLFGTHENVVIQSI